MDYDDEYNEYDEDMAAMAADYDDDYNDDQHYYDSLED